MSKSTLRRLAIQIPHNELPEFLAATFDVDVLRQALYIKTKGQLLELELQKRYDALFEMYVKHIHEHSLGAIPAMECTSCIQLANLQIDKHISQTEKEKN